MQNFRLVMCYDACVLYVPLKWSKSNPIICSFVGKKMISREEMSGSRKNSLRTMKLDMQ